MRDLDWCRECRAGREIEEISQETEVRNIDGTGADFRVVHLSCGHQIVIGRVA